VNLYNFFKNKKVLVTGHTGFKGSWLVTWLNVLGCKVLGISLDPIKGDNHFMILKKKLDIIDKRGDIRNERYLKKIIKQFKPDIVFHLAAQAIVSTSYSHPKLTFETNVLGTFNLLSVLAELKHKCIAIFITSDKCYKNIEVTRGYTETDEIGGDDFYSSSKASAELVIHSFYKSFIKDKNKFLRIATARAGNVVGGGDWSKNRLIPDCAKSWSKGQTVILRNPNSTRPWQHVLEALSGYLHLAYQLSKKKLVTLTAVRPPARFGPIKLAGSKVKTFKEKNKMEEGWINGGFFVIEPNFLNLIKNDQTFLEKEPLEKASYQNQLMAFKH
jgi:CDP-glucose 4,6-dehydratase